MFKPSTTFVEKRNLFGAFFGVCVLAFIAQCSSPVLALGSTVSSEYKYSPVYDDEILPGVMTEVWGQVTRPSELGNQPHPLIVMLHGNHPTCGSGSLPIAETSCQYTFTGSCAEGEFPIQSHRGYDYLANALAEQGYIVVSINANRGITCGNPDNAHGDWGLNLARGKLILRHLALLSQWNNFGNTPQSLGVDLFQKIDFSNVGLFGHSRGGEGVRAAYTLYQESDQPNDTYPWKKQIVDPLQIKGIFEVGPVDGQTDRTLNALGTAWNVLLPMCDGDVVALRGMRPFDRMIKTGTAEYPARPKSTYAVWGANHNFYNTEWQQSDSPGCIGTTPLWNGEVGSSEQRDTALQSVLPFFKANVSTTPDLSLANEFDPLHAPAHATRIDRSFVLSPNDAIFKQKENFSNALGYGLLGEPYVASNITVDHAYVNEHDPSIRAAEIVWNSASSIRYFQSNWKPSGEGYDDVTSATHSFDFRIGRKDSPKNSSPSTDLKIQFVFADDTLGPPLLLSTYASVVGPVGSGLYTVPSPAPSPFQDRYLHTTLQTVRIPSADLMGNSTKKVRGVRFTFDQTSQGDIFITHLGFSRFSNTELAANFVLPTQTPTNPNSVWKMKPTNSESPKNEIVQVRKLENDPSRVEILVKSSVRFQVRNALPVLRIDDREVAFGEFVSEGVNVGDLHFMRFKMKSSELASIPDTYHLQISHQEDSKRISRDLGVQPRSLFPKQ